MATARFFYRDVWLFRNEDTLRLQTCKRCWVWSLVVNQSETTSHVSYRFTAKSHIIHMGTHHEHRPISSSLTYTPLLS